MKNTPLPPPPGEGKTIWSCRLGKICVKGKREKRGKVQEKGQIEVKSKINAKGTKIKAKRTREVNIVVRIQ
jgi:hypothetical protein